MNYIGVYDSGYPRSTAGVCDAPCVAKGKMMLCAAHAVSEGNILAMAFGRIRNRAKLISVLGIRSDSTASQLVLQAYRKWSSNYPEYIEGPVMTCILDIGEERMVLSRDRMGEQPIFYTLCPSGGLIFSDHPDSLMKIAAALPVVSREGMCELFGLGPARTPDRTPFRDIKMLESGCMLTGEHGKICQRRYFAIREKKHTDDVTETIRHTRALLEAAVDDIAFLHPGVMLSGGLDSTALAALLRERCDGLMSFSVDYQDNAHDFKPNSFRPSMDEPYIEMAAKVFGTEHHRFVLEQSELAEALDTAVSARGFPGMADIDSSLLLFSGKIRSFANNVVSGECGDEVFCGYPWFRGEVKLSEDSFPWSGSMELRESILRPEVMRKLDLRGYVRSTITQAIEQTGIHGSDADREIRLKRMQLICFRFFMANLQERATRMCGSYGVNVLTPLCDDRLVEYVFNVPEKIKFMNGMEKGLFRAAVRDIMPKELNERKKSPYPKTCSPIYTEIIRGMTMAMLADCGAPIWEWVDRERVKAIAESPLDPNETPWFGQLMAGPQMLAYLWQVNTWMKERNVTVSL